MLADKLYSNVSLFILTFHIMVLCHNFLYIQNIFLGQELNLFVIISYVNLFTVFECDEKQMCCCALQAQEINIDVFSVVLG